VSTTRQDTDGTPYFAFYDTDTQLGFVWDGKSPVIEVSHGGMGEPVIDTFPVSPRDGLASARSGRWMDWFKLVCCNYVRLKVGDKSE
jgi:hypothetical protein